jgi:hypothetical protein
MKALRFSGSEKHFYRNLIRIADAHLRRKDTTHAQGRR